MFAQTTPEKRSHKATLPVTLSPAVAIFPQTLQSAGPDGGSGRCLLTASYQLYILSSFWKTFFWKKNHLLWKNIYSILYHNPSNHFQHFISWKFQLLTHCQSISVPLLYHKFLVISISTQIHPLNTLVTSSSAPYLLDPAFQPTSATLQTLYPLSLTPHRSDCHFTFLNHSI